MRCGFLCELLFVVILGLGLDFVLWPQHSFIITICKMFHWI